MSRPGRRLCFVVQRYGLEVAGGAETLCREVAARLSRHYDLTVLTTCALDYLTWKNHYPPGESRLDGVLVRRFPVEKERKVRSFGRLSRKLYSRSHSLSDEVRWMEKQGPDAPSLFRHIFEEEGSYDLFIFFTYLYATTFFGLPKVPRKSLLVPMAHPEEPLGFDIFRILFHLPRGFIFNTPEERDLVHRTFDCGYLPDTIAGVGIDIPANQKEEGRKPVSDTGYILYTGRLDIQKGTEELFDFFTRYSKSRPGTPLRLLLAGKRKMTLPRHPSISYLGFLPEEEKLRAIAGAVAAVVPSPHESLSISALEAWALGRPVLANGNSSVLDGQCRRSGAGLTYTDYNGFESALDRLLDEKGPGDDLGRRGQQFVSREYSWEIIEKKYTLFIDSMLRTIATG